MVPRATTQTQITMEATDKEVIEKKVYVHDNEKKEYASKGVAGTALGLGIAGTALALWGRGNGLGIGGEALRKHLELVRRLRKEAANESDKTLGLFKEYTEKYADMPYSEFLKMRRNQDG